MYCYIAVVFILMACAITQVASQEVVTMRWNQVCDDTLESCTFTYLRAGPQNLNTTRQYYTCVFSVFCERWSDGYYNKQNILGEIQARMEYYDPQGVEWWKNAACDHKLSFRNVIISLFVILKVLHCISR